MSFMSILSLSVVAAVVAVLLGASPVAACIAFECPAGGTVVNGGFYSAVNNSCVRLASNQTWVCSLTFYRTYDTALPSSYRLAIDLTGKTARVETAGNVPSAQQAPLDSLVLPFTSGVVSTGSAAGETLLTLVPNPAASAGGASVSGNLSFTLKSAAWGVQPQIGEVYAVGPFSATGLIPMFAIDIQSGNTRFALFAAGSGALVAAANYTNLFDPNLVIPCDLARTDCVRVLLRPRSLPNSPFAVLPPNPALGIFDCLHARPVALKNAVLVTLPTVEAPAVASVASFPFVDAAERFFDPATFLSFACTDAKAKCFDTEAPRSVTCVAAGPNYPTKEFVVEIPNAADRPALRALAAVAALATTLLLAL